MQNIMSGLFNARIFSAIVKSFPDFLCGFSELFLLVVFTDEGFLQRMPPTFSWTELFKASSFLKIRLKIGCT